MVNKILVDTNILIHLLNGNPKSKSILLGKEICISFVTEMELLSKRSLTKSDIKIIELLIESCTIFEMNDRIKEAATIIMRNNRFKMPDAIIAATSQYYNLELLTADDTFSSIESAQIVKL